jgi:G3E family GTPase
MRGCGVTQAHIITGSFGAGKTTAIRRLMQDKPADELWVVILNEFTDAGLDALTVAQAARGLFDVRLVAGGCLCCVGELEFGRQLEEILGRIRPTRLLIEPSGAGHAGDIVDELAAFEDRGLLTVDSIVCLIDPIDALRLADAHAPAARDEAAWGQVQSADVLLLSKADLADAAAETAFVAIAAAQFPAKAFVGRCAHGALPAAALAAYRRAPGFTLMHAGEATVPVSTAFPIGRGSGVETHVAQLGFHACSWTLPRELIFSREALEPRLEWLLAAHGGQLRRLKAVFRLPQGPSWLVQAHGRGLAGEASAYRRDSRVELVLNAAPTPQLLADWRALLRDTAA